MQVIKSILITVIISSLFAWIFSNHFVSVFAFTFAFQFVAFYVGRTIYENYIKVELFRIQADREKEAQKRFLMLQCPCSEKNQQDVEINLQDSSYECAKCKKTINTSVEVKNLLATEPVYFDSRTK